MMKSLIKLLKMLNLGRLCIVKHLHLVGILVGAISGKIKSRQNMRPPNRNAVSNSVTQ